MKKNVNIRIAFLSPLIFSLLTCFSLSAQITNKEEFILTGHIEGRDTGIIILWYPKMNGQFIKDTGFLDKGNFQFEGKIPAPSFCWLKDTVAHGNSAGFFLEAGEQQMTLQEKKFDSFIMDGSFTQKQYDSLQNQLKNIDLKYEKWIEKSQVLINELSEINDSAEKAKTEDSLAELEKVIKTKNEESANTEILFISDHADSYVSPGYLHLLMHNRLLTRDSAASLYNKFSDRIKNSIAAKLLKEELDKRKINIEASNFSARTTENISVSLNNFKGKYVLLNFWASWCAPCITEIPDLKKLFATYDANGFEILNISIDKKREDWIQAVTKYQIEKFCNVIANDDIAKKYSNVTQPIPSQILINRKGVVIWNSMNQSSESLKEILKKEFDE